MDPAKAAPVKWFDDAGACEGVKQAVRGSNKHTNPFVQSFTQCFTTAGTQRDLEALVARILEAPPSSSSTRSSSARKAKLGIYSLDPANAVATLRYVFAHHKRGIYVQIRGGSLRLFSPFANMAYRNHLTPRQAQQARAEFADEIRTQGWLPDPQAWYVDGCLIKPCGNWVCNTPDWYYAEYYFMLHRLLQKHTVRDVDFIINTANFPLFATDPDDAASLRCDPHDDVSGRRCDPRPAVDFVPCPVFSGFKRDYHNDILIPNGYDIQMASGKVFLGTSSKVSGCSRMFPPLRDATPFAAKRDAIVWRGSLSTCGGTVETSCRAKVASLPDTASFLDAKLVKGYDAVVHKTPGTEFHRARVDARAYGAPMSHEEQLSHKYVMMLGGTNTNASLPYLMQSNSLVLFGGDHAGYKMWYSDALRPGKHYLPVDCGLPAARLAEALKAVVDAGLRSAAPYERIVRNAQAFYRAHITMDAIVDYSYSDFIMGHPYRLPSR